MKTDGAQFCSTRTRAKIAKKTQTITQQGHQTIGSSTITVTHRETVTEQQNYHHRVRISLITK